VSTARYCCHAASRNRVDRQQIGMLRRNLAAVAAAVDHPVAEHADLDMAIVYPGQVLVEGTQLSEARGTTRPFELTGMPGIDIDLANRLLHVRRSKTPAGWRSPTLNATCLSVLQELHDTSAKLGFTDPTHFVFPWHGRDKQLDPTKGMTSWRTAWRSLRKAAGLTHVRFHDGRHTAITTLAEKGLPDWVIQAQVGHVAPEMMKTYSHIRRQALNQAADALEPLSAPKPASPMPSAMSPQAAGTSQEGVMSPGTSQHDPGRGRILDFPSVLPET
jgi:hypothetical protein